MRVVTNNSSLLVHMIIRLSDGSIAENTRRTGRPSRMILGNGSLSLAFEKNLIGLKIGDSANFHLEAEDAFGRLFPDNIMNFPKEQFNALSAEEPIEVGGLIEFENMNGQIMVGVVKTITEEIIVIDFNHPLADQALDFEIELLTID